MSDYKYNTRYERLGGDWSWDGQKLRDWRKKHKTPMHHILSVLRVSQASYYRYELYDIPPIDVANRIVRMTRGAIRYSDIYPGFVAKYA